MYRLFKDVGSCDLKFFFQKFRTKFLGLYACFDATVNKFDLSVLEVQIALESLFPL